MNKTQCLSDPRNLWLNEKYNFDNLGRALMALFVLSSKDGWVGIMYSGLDAVGVDQQVRFRMFVVGVVVVVVGFLVWWFRLLRCRCGVCCGR